MKISTYSSFCGLLIMLLIPLSANANLCSNWIEVVAGTIVNVRLNEALDPDYLSEGQVLNCKIFGAVSFNSQVLFKHDDLAFAKVVEIRKERRKATVVLLEVQGAKAVDGQMISLYSAYIILKIVNDQRGLGTLMTGFVKSNTRVEP